MSELDPFAETPAATPPAATPAGDHNPRKRGRTACTRCKNRKQKCDEQLPVCSNCRRAGASDCDKADVASQPLPIAYTRALEDRVAQLEMMLAEEGANKRARTERTERTETACSGPATTTPVPLTVAAPMTPTHAGTGTPDALSEVVGIISLGNFEAPAYVGPSAGLSLAVNLGEMVQATVWKKAIPEHGGVLSPTGAGTSSHRGVRAMTKEEMLRYSVKEPPSDALGARLLNLYLAQPHARYPFLQPAELWTLHHARYEHAPAAATGLSLAQRYGIFKLYMVYAIGATLLQLTEKTIESDLSPERFYMTALQHMAAAREPRTVQNIEAMTLLVIYHLRSASGLGLWYMIGLAMRTCIDLGMHRRSHEQGLSSEGVQARRRLFWTVYALERVIAMSLGRPLSLPDRHIDVHLPDVDGHGHDNENLQEAVLLFQLRRIEARIHHSIYRADKPLVALRPKLDTLYKLLEDWHSTLGDKLGGQDSPGRARGEYLLLHYHRAVRMLIQPFLVLLPVTDPYFERCLAAAGRICQAHKRLHQSRHYGHSFIAVQTIFVAGATLLYGLWTHTHRVWNVTLADDLRACSLVLFVMSERAAWVRKYRDAFELLVAATMQKLGSEGGNGGRSNVSETADNNNNNSSSSSNNNRNMADMAAMAQQTCVGVEPPQSQHQPGHHNHHHHNHHSHSHHQHERISPDETPASHVVTNTVPAFDEEGDVWHLVKELANWIDQDTNQDPGGHDTTAVWMPDFETLQAFPSCTPR
ncbi:hypothetical protein SBRCBS47491_000774 [Sporothrix bragantina]|uniref:Zn(2)-C6 fungal-type domain-containing protein n=1 Tax=Sporothrix bragantina TaxID=671064 RepID=A0ABP0AT16_9PEZI